jgi:uroporphyrinogen decarboxylase
MMRQAGRYLPEFIALRDKYDFFHALSNARISCGNYSSTIRRIAPDAAILFSDILVIPRHGIEVEMKPNFGPYLPNPIRTIQDVEKVIVPDVHETLGYVFDAIKLTKEMLNDEVPLIGFAGSPWTIMCYAVEGVLKVLIWPKDFNIQKQHMFYCKKLPILQLRTSKKK